MRFLKLFLCCLILSAVSLNVDGFSLLGWIKNVFHSDDSRELNLNESNLTKTNVSYDADSYEYGYAKKTGKRSSTDYSDSWEANQIPATCDEDAILLPLARLKIISPEKIIELLATSSLEFTCEHVNSTINEVKTAIEACENFPENHLYKKLCDGLEYFSSTVCVDISDDAKKRKNDKKGLLDHWECYTQLQDDLYDCEGAPDWFEKKNRSAACQFYSDVIDCNYIKAALLCGKEAAKLLRDFSDAVMRSVLTFHCKISRSEPHVDDALIACAFRIQINEAYLLIVISIFLLFVL